jgi:hypothetical protein
MRGTLYFKQLFGACLPAKAGQETARSRRLAYNYMLLFRAPLLRFTSEGKEGSYFTRTTTT